MFRQRHYAFLLFCALAAPLCGQNLPGYGWSSMGVLPFHGYDFLPFKTPTRYIAYYTRKSAATLDQQASDKPGRAFSTDLKTWSADNGDICATSGDLCVNGSLRNAGVLTLPDGRFRMFLRERTAELVSSISSDGVTWTREPGVRFTVDPNSIFERGNFQLAWASFATLPDNSIRMYFQGGVVPGSPGTPAYYNQDATFNGVLLKSTGMILSAISKDNGLTWTRESGVRINPLVHGPARVVQGFDRKFRADVDLSDFTSVTVRENGRTVYRIYASTWATGTVSYISYDGLSFTLEGQVPADRGDPKALVLPDGRIWLITNQYPDAINDTIVYGPQPLVLNSTRAYVPIPPGATGGSGFFQSARMGITGTSTGSVTFEAVAGPASGCGNPCGFRPELFNFRPATGSPSFFTDVLYTGPSTTSHEMLIVHAKAPEVTAVGAVYCMTQTLDKPDSSPFCKFAAPELPMNAMSFAFTPGAPAATQVSNIQSLGGPGYPFTVASSVPWATVSPANGTAPAALTVRVDPAGLAPGTYTGVVTISAETTTQQITVTTVVSAGPQITSVRNAASLATAISPGSFISIFGSAFAAAPEVWSPTTSLPTTLAGVRVRIGGKEVYISYADPRQLNVLTPSDLAVGNVILEVTSPAGTASTTVSVAPVAPGWFSYSVGSNTWIAALFANTATLVAPAGSLGTVQSRSARAGDILQLYANGLGATSPAAPDGIVLTTAYPLTDFSRVAVTIGGKPATVLFAGLVSAGLYQLNAQVPPLASVGDLPVELYVDGRPTPGGPLLNFQ